MKKKPMKPWLNRLELTKKTNSFSFRALFQGIRGKRSLRNQIVSELGKR